MNSSTSSLSGDLSLHLLLPTISRPTFPHPPFSFLRRLRRRLPIVAADLRPPAAFLNKNSRQKQLNQEYEDDDEEDDDDDGEDESAAAEEYEYESVVSEEEEDEEDEEEIGGKVEKERVEVKEEGMRQRVERVVNLVKELGEDFLDFEELASIYDFSIDKFQV